jgi:hypothetical protein
MHTLTIYLDGIGLLGPGLSNWENARPVLAGHLPYTPAPIALPAIEKLPPAERRRVGVPVKLSMAIGLEAARHAEADLSLLATVFSSTEADCDNSHAILEALASSDRAVSPTRFHNSVHNAPSGYWGIATGCMQPSTSLCAYDATFAAGLLEAATQASQTGQACMVLAYDTVFPQPLRSLRPLPDAMGVALILTPRQTTAARARLTISLTNAPASTLPQAALESLRQQIPVARALPLLSLLARDDSATVVLDYLDDLRLAVEVSALCPTRQQQP